MTLPVDEFILHYHAEHDWRDSTSGKDMSRGLTFKMLMCSMQGSMPTGTTFNVTPLDPTTGLYKIGYDHNADPLDYETDGVPRWRTGIKLKIPDPPFKGLIPKQISLWLPYDKDNSYIDDNANPAAELCVGKVAKGYFKFGNGIVEGVA